MGSPLGPSYANILMCHNEVKWLNECPDLFKPIWYKRYADDTFLIFKDSSHPQMFLNYINSKHSKIKFTYDQEVNDKLSFLDVNLTKTPSGTISTSVFRKKTFTCQSLNWFSFCPEIFKLNSIQTLIHRAFNITSNYSLFHKEMMFLKDLFVSNNYSTEVFYQILKSFLAKKYKQAPTFDTVPKCYIKLNYLFMEMT